MPLSDIKKGQQMPQRPQAIPTASAIQPPPPLPGYSPPAGMAGYPGQQQTQPRAYDAAAIAQGGEEAAQYYPPLPTYRWVSRYFQADTLKDEAGQQEIGDWLTLLEETTNRVIGVQAFYLPGGAIVIAKVQEIIE